MLKTILKKVILLKSYGLKTGKTFVFRIMAYCPYGHSKNPNFFLNLLIGTSGFISNFDENQKKNKTGTSPVLIGTTTVSARLFNLTIAGDY